MNRGRWDHSLNKYYDENPNSLEVVWRAHPFPSNYAENYGFTKFAMELNGKFWVANSYLSYFIELTPDCQDFLPGTDTRYRPDQRYFFLCILFTYVIQII